MVTSSVERYYGVYKYTCQRTASPPTLRAWNSISTSPNPIAAISTARAAEQGITFGRQYFFRNLCNPVWCGIIGWRGILSQRECIHQTTLLRVVTPDISSIWQWHYVERERTLHCSIACFSCMEEYTVFWGLATAKFLFDEAVDGVTKPWTTTSKIQGHTPNDILKFKWRCPSKMEKHCK